jgi:DUF4097 and DUF4098 domain-containing protein YvlB
MDRRSWPLLLLTLAACATARPLDLHAPLAPDGSVVIEVPAGEVAVLGWDRNEVSVTGEVADLARTTALTGDRSRAVLQFADGASRADVELDVRVPHGASVEIRTVTADVWVDAVAGDLDIATATGELDLRGAPRSVAVSTASSDILLDVPTDTVTAATVNGDISVTGARFAVTCEAIDGDIVVATTPTLARLVCETLDGDVRVAGPVPTDAIWTIAVHAGDVALRTAGAVDATFALQTLAGELRCRFADRRHDDGAPVRRLECRAGAGAARVTIETLGGDIVVH